MKKILSMILIALLLVPALPVMASGEPAHLVDDAGLLSSYEEEALEEALSSLSDKWDMDMVVVTADDLGGKSSRAYADDFYDYGGYGYDGILWLIDMDNRQSTISTCGYGITVFTDAGQDRMQDILAPMLTDEAYANAIEEFIDLCDDYCQRADAGEPYDVGSLPRESFAFGRSLFIALAVGLVIAFIATAVMKGQLKSVRAKAAASDYLKPGSLQVTEARDLFLYRNVDRRAKPRESSGGSSTHRSSSGRSHGGSSRSF